MRDRQHRSFCSFCGRHNTETPKLVTGPDVSICTECIRCAAEIAGIAVTPDEIAEDADAR